MSQQQRRARLARTVLVPALACALALPPTTRPAPLAAQEAASAVQDVTLTDLVLPLGSTVLRAPKVTVSGTRLSRDDLTALLRADSPEPWAARLARLEAASIAIPVLVSEHAGPGAARRTLTYREVTARDVRAGRIAELSAAGAAVTVADEARGGSGTYGRILASDLDLTALARLYGVPGDGKGAVQRVYALFQASDLVYTERDGTSVRLARLEGRDLGGRQIPGGWGGALDVLAAGLDALNARSELPPPERARLAGTAADLAEAVAAGSLEAQGLSFSETATGGAPLLIEIARIAYAAGAEAAATLEGLALTQGELRARLGRLSLSGFSLAPTVANLRRLARPEAEAGPAELRRLVPALGSLSLQDLSLDLPAAAPAPAADPLARTKADGKEAAGLRLALRDAALGFGPARDGLPTASRLSLSGLVLPTAAVSATPGLGSLAAFGYRDLDLDLVADTAWDETKREFAVREFSLSGREMGTLRVSGTLGGIGPELFAGKVPATDLLMLTATAKALDLRIENAGLFERFIATQSKALSLKPEELRQEYVAASQFGVPVILGNSAAAKAIGAAMGAFVTKPGSLAVSARAKAEPGKAEPGLGFADFAFARTPGDVLGKLDVDARAE